MADINATQYGSFVATSNVWDVSEIYSTEITSPEFKELLVRLYQNINNISISLNTRDAGYYDTQEFVNGQILFPNPSLNSTSSTTATFRQIYRKVINFGALPNTGTKSVAHGIICTTATTFTRIYATASDTTGLTYLPIPYADAAGIDNIQLDVDATNVNITTASDRTNYNICYVVLEYVQS